MIKIFHLYEPLPNPQKLLVKTARAVYKGENVPTDKVTSVILCSDYYIRKLNREHRRKDKVTDVLSFTFGDPDLLGEVYISLQRTAVQARRHRTTYENELKRLLIHGLLHLMGYDHAKKPERDIMESAEEKYDMD